MLCGSVLRRTKTAKLEDFPSRSDPFHAWQQITRITCMSRLDSSPVEAQARSIERLQDRRTNFRHQVHEPRTWHVRPSSVACDEEFHVSSCLCSGVLLFSTGLVGVWLPLLPLLARLINHGSLGPSPERCVGRPFERDCV